MKPTTEYRIIHVSVGISSKKAVAKLEQAVSEAMREGWEPLGGIGLTDHTFAQAMVRSR